MSLVAVNNFTFHYPHQTPVIDNISFALEPGSFNLLLGLNGSGKTTLIRQLTPTFSKTDCSTGTILFDGKYLSEVEPGKIGYVMQNPEQQIVTDKVWHELAFGLENLGISSPEIQQRVAEIANFFGIQSWFDEDTNSLSGGQKQLLNLASIVIMNPALIILDEPTAQLDPIATDNFIQMLHKLNYELGITILITEHQIQKLLPYTTHILVIQAGQITINASKNTAIKHIFNLAPELTTILPAATQLAYPFPPTMTNIPQTVSSGQTWLQKKLENSTNFAISNAAVSKELSRNPAIVQAKNLWFSYAEGANDIVKNADISVNSGEIVAILGGNGSGKSTFFKLLLGQLFPKRGKLKVNGRVLHNKKQLREYYKNVGYLPQDPTALFLKPTVLEDLHSVKQPGLANQTFETQLAAGVAAFGIEKLLANNPLDLSGGQQQLVGLLKVLLRRPQILYLDEPTKGLDAVAKINVANILTELAKKNVAIVIISHDLDFVAQYSDRVGLFFNGNIPSFTNSHAFFSKNLFYTTEASRISRGLIDNAITVDEVKSCLTAK